MKIGYTPHFLRKFKSLTPEIQEESFEAIEAFSDKKNHKRLKIHKLKGSLTGIYSFSVNYHIRILFEYVKPDQVILIAIGNHEIYKQ
ncbi:MAG: type II toxin-antitoxin system RelE/ParE family toxin [bacterium]|nr:type II toxin-antitoxin system RelE/ParE family toxin [bacterium]